MSLMASKILNHCSLIINEVKIQAFAHNYSLTVNFVIHHTQVTLNLCTPISLLRKQDSQQEHLHNLTLNDQVHNNKNIKNKTNKKTHK